MNSSLKISLLTTLIFLGVTPSLSLAENWYIGGTLHRVTLGRWQHSSYENKLATAATWVLMQPGVRKIGRKSSSMNSVRPYAEELVGCIDKVSGAPPNNTQTASSLAAACMVSLGW